MKKYLHAFAMCQSMFCAIPFPWHVWDEEARDKMLLFLPAVGLEIGVLWSILAWLTTILSLPLPVRGLILCAYPFIVTGYIHLDGFMDVTDAVKSCRSLERRREILKDPHVGSFAVIGAVLLILAQFSLFSSVEGNPGILIFIPAVSRCCSSLAITLLKPMSTSQYASKKPSKSFVWIMVLTLFLLIASGFLFCERYGFSLVGGLIGYGLALRHSYKSLDGMNGDISGYALTVSELCAAAVCALL